MNRSVAALLLATLLVSGGCTRRGEDPGPDPTVPTAPPTTPTTATTVPPNPFATPTTIDGAYIERVLVPLNKVYGDTARGIIETHHYQRSDRDRLGAIFNPPLLQLQVNGFRDILDFDRKLFKDPIGYRRMTVLEVITARPDCVFAKIKTDVSDVVVSPPPQQDSYITFTLKPADADPASINPTPWSMANESDARQDPCAP